jgi:hypothetical protein
MGLRMAEDQEQRPPSLLPYDDWAEAALREVVARAVDHAATNGLLGNHHFYISFRTDRPDVLIPERLRAQYPDEMTIVLQHQFWDLRFDKATQTIGVGLSFSGVPSNLTIPLSSVTAFADPAVNFGLRFRAAGADGAIESKPQSAPGAKSAKPVGLPSPVAPAEKPPAGAETPQIVSLDAFRRKPPTRDGSG